MRSSTRRFAGLLGTLWFALGVTAAARADDELAERALTPPPDSNAPPRFTRSDAVGAPQPGLPGYRSELTELSYRRWASHGSTDLGIGLGTVIHLARPIGGTFGPIAGDPAFARGSGTVLTLGMRYRTSERSALYADASGVHGLGLEGSETVVGKVGWEFKSAQSRWDIAYGGLGLRLGGDTRMTMRVNRSGLTLMMRSTF